MKTMSIFLLSMVTLSAGNASGQTSSHLSHDIKGVTMNHHDHTKHGETPASGSAVVKAYEAVNEKMHKAMAVELTGDADLDFIRGMIPHHQGAVEMARVVLEHGKDPAVRKLAQAVVAAQEQEIDVMQRWLSERGK